LEDSAPDIIKSKVVKLIPQFVGYCPDKEISRRTITYDLLQNLLLIDTLEVRQAVSEAIMDIIVKMKSIQNTTSGLQMDILDQEWIIIIMRKLYNDNEEQVRLRFCLSLSNAYTLCGAERFVSEL